MEYKNLIYLTQENIELKNRLRYFILDKTDDKRIITQIINNTSNYFTEKYEDIDYNIFNTCIIEKKDILYYIENRKNFVYILIDNALEIKQNFLYNIQKIDYIKENIYKKDYLMKEIENINKNLKNEFDINTINLKIKQIKRNEKAIRRLENKNKSYIELNIKEIDYNLEKLKNEIDILNKDYLFVKNHK